jgi:DNA-binding transcriptional ArsR family regulator
VGGSTGRAPRGANRQAILKVIEERPDASSGELASKTGIAKPTLYTTLRSLVNDGLLEKRDVGGVSGYHLKVPAKSKNVERASARRGTQAGPRSRS